MGCGLRVWVCLGQPRNHPETPPPLLNNTPSPTGAIPSVGHYPMGAPRPKEVSGVGADVEVVAPQASPENGAVFWAFFWLFNGFLARSGLRIVCSCRLL